MPRSPSGASCSMALNESPSEKEGKYTEDEEAVVETDPSMKVPPKRKGNPAGDSAAEPGHRHPQ